MKMAALGRHYNLFYDLMPSVIIRENEGGGFRI